MRAIKFRGKTLGGDWVYGNFTELKQKVNITEAGFYISNSVGLPFAYQIRPETRGQFTGLHDKNGKEVYEGDICLCEVCNNWDGEFKKEQVIIKFSYGAFSPVYLNDREFCDDSERPIRYKNFEVIGNIYENKELLTQS